MSVLHDRHVMQWSLGSFLVLILAVSVGCQPSQSEKNVPSQEVLKHSLSEGISEPAGLLNDDLPAVETPVGDLPEAEPMEESIGIEVIEQDEPIEPEENTSAQELPISPKVANDAEASEVDPTMDPTVAWLPKPVENADAKAKDQAGMKSYVEQIPGTDVKFEMVPIPGGTFKLGSPDDESDRNDDEGPQVEVKIDPFWMEAHEATWGEYELWGLGLDQQRRKALKTESTMWDNTADALTIPTKPYADMTFGMGKNGYPAVCMTQFAAKMYCKWLSAKTGRFYRLPTEAEWEYACRAGSTGAYSFGDDPDELDDYGWHEGNSDEQYQKVGKKKPNAWGLYDMHGNVAELCLDQYISDRYKQLGDGVIDNPVLIVTKMYPRVVRGGAWTDEVEILRSAARQGSSRDWKSQDPQIPQSIWYFTDANFVGFRVVRPLHTPTPEEAAQYDITDFEKEELIDYKESQAGKM